MFNFGALPTSTAAPVFNFNLTGMPTSTEKKEEQPKTQEQASSNGSQKSQTTSASEKQGEQSTNETPAKKQEEKKKEEPTTPSKKQEEKKKEEPATKETPKNKQEEKKKEEETSKETPKKTETPNKQETKTAASEKEDKKSESIANLKWPSADENLPPMPEYKLNWNFNAPYDPTPAHSIRTSSFGKIEERKEETPEKFTMPLNIPSFSTSSTPFAFPATGGPTPTLSGIFGSNSSPSFNFGSNPFLAANKPANEEGDEEGNEEGEDPEKPPTVETTVSNSAVLQGTIGT